MNNTVLTKDNIADWKQELDKEMKGRHDMNNYSSTVSDEEWLSMYEGETVEDAIADEVAEWDEDYDDEDYDDL